MQTTHFGEITVHHRGDWSGEAEVHLRGGAHVVVDGRDLLGLAKRIIADALGMAVISAVEDAVYRFGRE